MDMKEVFFCCAVEQYVATLLKEKYPFGIVGVWGGSAEFLAMLKKQQTPYIEVADAGLTLPTSARYVVAFGGVDNILHAKAHAKERIVVLCPNILNFSILANINIIDNKIEHIGYPNYTILSQDMLDIYISDMLQVATELYVSSLDIMAGAVDIERGVTQVLKASSTFIIGTSNGEQEVVNLIRKAMELWDSGAISPIMLASLIRHNTQGVREEAGIIFSIYLLAQFTKYQISGILYGADRVRIRKLFALTAHNCTETNGVLYAPNYSILQRFLPSGDLLWGMKEACGWHKGCINSIQSSCKQTIDNLLLATELTETTGALSYFASVGLLEGVRNEDYS